MKTIRIWMGCKVVGVVTATEGGLVASRSGGAENSTKVDVEIDPWAGLIVDHSTDNPPIPYREAQP